MNKKKAANYIQDLGALIALVLLIVVIGAISPEFRTVGNFLSLLRQSSINGLIAFGMTCVILTETGVSAAHRFCRFRDQINDREGRKTYRLQDLFQAECRWDWQ